MPAAHAYVRQDAASRASETLAECAGGEGAHDRTDERDGDGYAQF
jgi:hypothetical protein